MQFTNPIWLWGLTGLMIPIGIHFLSRREGKIIKIGSIRHLQETDSKQFKSIRLNEIALLLLRCLMLTVLVLLLSGMHFTAFNKSSKWLLVETGLEGDEQLSVLIDSLEREGFELKRLASGFPDLNDSLSDTKKVNYWNLLSELEKTSALQAVVLTYNYAEGFRGRRRPLPRNVTWISKNPPPTEYIAKAIRLSNDSLVVRVGYSNQDKTSFSTGRAAAKGAQKYFASSRSDSIVIEIPKAISIQVVFDTNFSTDTRMIIAALQAIDDERPDSFKIEAIPLNGFSSEKKYDWTIWLSETLCPIDNHCIYYETKLSQERFEERSSASWALSQRLSEQTALEQNLTVHLGLILAHENKFDETVQRQDKRALPEELLWAPALPKPPAIASPATKSSEKILICFLLLSILLERWTAFKRNQ